MEEKQVKLKVYRPAENTGNYCARRDNRGNCCSYPIYQHFNEYGERSYQSCSNNRCPE